jgi:hypothetical protein
MNVYCVWAYDQYYPTGPRDLQAVYAKREDADRHEAQLNALNTNNAFDYIKVTVEELK